MKKSFLLVLLSLVFNLNTFADESGDDSSFDEQGSESVFVPTESDESSDEGSGDLIAE